MGNAVVLPGDIAFGDKEGVSFIPPSPAGSILDKAKPTSTTNDGRIGSGARALAGGAIVRAIIDARGALRARLAKTPLTEPRVSVRAPSLRQSRG